MGKLKLETTTQVTATVNLKNAPMVVSRCEEHVKLGKVVKDAQARQKRIREEIPDIFKKDKQGKALVQGCEIGEYGLKLVTGKRKVIDWNGLMDDFGFTPADLERYTSEEDNEPYVKITKKGEKD